MRRHEAQRPAYGQYIFVHLFLPHGPFHVDQECRPKFAGWPTAAKCSIKLMTDLISILKSLGRLKNSIILFHSDHGNNYFPMREENKKVVREHGDLRGLFFPIRLSPTPTICSVSPWTAGKGRRRRIEEAIRLILDCSENRTGV